MGGIENQHLKQFDSQQQLLLFSEAPAALSYTERDVPKECKDARVVYIYTASAVRKNGRCVSVMYCLLLDTPPAQSLSATHTI